MMRNIQLIIDQESVKIHWGITHTRRSWQSQRSIHLHNIFNVTMYFLSRYFVYLTDFDLMVPADYKIMEIVKEFP